MNLVETSEGSENLLRPKLLLADDSPTIRKVVELTFADEGIEVTTAGDAGSAMEEFVRTQPDIVLVDINLPGTSGYKICEMIKQDEATSRIPVLLLVGSFEPFDQDEAERVSADGFLLKPFKSIRELVGRVKELLASPALDNAEDPGSDNDPIADVSEWSELESADNIGEMNDIENLYEQSLIDTAEIQELETVDDLFVDSGLDDELIDAMHHSNAAPNYPNDRPEFMGTGGDAATTDPFLSRVVESGSEANQAGSFPGSVNGVDHIPYQESAAESDLVRTENAPVPSAPGFELSEELIAKIADRVVERLSGREIRDVAREVVPRIAEKLIREALAEDKKG